MGEMAAARIDNCAAFKWIKIDKTSYYHHSAYLLLIISLQW